MSRLVMADVLPPGEKAPEAEPVTVEVEQGGLTLTLDDGTELSFWLSELQQAIDGEQAPGEREVA